MRIWLALALAGAVWAQLQPAGTLERAERTIGPIALGDRSFSVKLASVRLAGATPAEAVESIEILDAEGIVHWQRRLMPRVEGNRFEEAVEVDAQPLQGKKGQGLLLGYTMRPAAPLSGRSWQAFGLVEGKLGPLSKPVTLEGDLLEDAAGKPAVAAFDEALLADVLNFRVWTGRFFAIVPVILNWDWGSARLAYPAARGRFNVWVQHGPAEVSGSVSLYPATNEKSEPAPVAVRRDSKVEILSAEGGLVWEESDEHIWLSVSEDLWLRVRIDGVEGWLHSEEDLDAIGLTEKN